MLPQSSWFTGVRIERLGTALRVIPSPPPGLPMTQVSGTVWRGCGGSVDEVLQLFGVLNSLGLTRVHDENARRTRAGDAVARTLAKGDRRSLAMALIRAGCFHDQARVLLECGRIDSDGNLHCQAKLARAGSPQLLGVLTSWDDVSIYPSVVISKSLLAELNTIWALLPPPVEMPNWAVERKQVGDRAEMYTVQYERTLGGDPSAIVWVARDSDDLGWDVEDRSVDPRRRIEVKGRRDTEHIFFLSDREWEKAQEYPSSYEVHFWGGIDLAKPPAIEYAALRAAGYPLVIKNIASHIRDGVWVATAIRWKVQKAES